MPLLGRAGTGFDFEMLKSLDGQLVQLRVCRTLPEIPDEPKGHEVRGVNRMAPIGRLLMTVALVRRTSRPPAPGTAQDIRCVLPVDDHIS
jgi:hypothetical protein